jgi:hypothetical protein
MQNQLLINGIKTKIDAKICIRWVENIDGSAYPVLYKNGKRVVEEWSIILEHQEPADPYGGNANTT